LPLDLRHAGVDQALLHTLSKMRMLRGENTLSKYLGLAEGLQKSEAHAEATKTWAECPIEQKLERLREELMGNRQQRRWEQERFGRVDEKLRHLENHQHGTDGTVMVRTRDLERGYAECGQAISGNFDPLA
jgi:hypothetical protein